MRQDRHRPVFEQEAQLSDEGGEPMRVRRITVVLDVPTRDGETEVHILTDLPSEAADALTIAELYRKRWTVEAAFGELATCLNGEVNTLGYPKAALFAFCVALMSYNVLGVVKGPCDRCMVLRLRRRSRATTWPTRSGGHTGE